MSTQKGAVKIRLDVELYPEEALRAAAAALRRVCDVRLGRPTGGRSLVELRPRSAAAADVPRDLEGEFLNEALSALVRFEAGSRASKARELIYTQALFAARAKDEAPQPLPEGLAAELEDIFRRSQAAFEARPLDGRGRPA